MNTGNIIVIGVMVLIGAAILIPLLTSSIRTLIAQAKGDNAAASAAAAETANNAAAALALAKQLSGQVAAHGEQIHQLALATPASMATAPVSVTNVQTEDKAR